MTSNSAQFMCVCCHVSSESRSLQLSFSSNFPSTHTHTHTHSNAHTGTNTGTHTHGHTNTNRERARCIAMSSHRYENINCCSQASLEAELIVAPSPPAPSCSAQLLRLLWLVYRAQQAVRRAGRQSVSVSGSLPTSCPPPLSPARAMLAALSVGKQARNRLPTQQPL